MNPYTGQNFFGFFKQLLIRVGHFFSEPSFQLATDEIQIIALLGIGIAASIVGVFLVYRKMTMLANALSHSLLFGIVSIYLAIVAFGGTLDIQSTLTITTLSIASIFSGIVTLFLTNLLCQGMKLQEDAGISLVFTTLFSLGIVLVTIFTKNAHIGSELIMGNVDALRKEDLKGILFSTLLTGGVITLFYRGFFLTTFDSSVAKVLGFSSKFYNYLLMILASFVATSAFRAIGLLMMISFFIFPPVIGRFFTNRFSTLLLVSSLIGCLSGVVGVALSRHLLTMYSIGLSTSGLVVAVMLLFFLIAFCKQKLAFWVKRVSSSFFSKETKAHGPASFKKTT